MISKHQTERFRALESIKRIEEYVNAQFHKGDVERKERVFYHYNEWVGWRFYLKAIKYRDWESLGERVLSTLRLR